MTECHVCNSDDTEVYPPEDATELPVLHCYNCGSDRVLKS